MTRQKWFWRVGVIVGGVAIISTVGCVLPWLMMFDQTQKAVTAADLSGYWMSVELPQGDEEGDQEKTSDADVDFWQFTLASKTGQQSMYSVTHPCRPGDIVAYAWLYEDGSVQILDIDSGAMVNAAFNDGDADTVAAMDEVDQSTWTAYRVEAPDCAGSDEEGLLIVGMSPVELNDTWGEPEEEPVQAKTSNAQSIEEEEMLMGLGLPTPTGLVHLTESLGSLLTVGEEYVKPTNAPTSSCTSAGTTIDCNQPAAHPGYVMCVDQGLSAARTQQLADVAALIDTDQVYPGALLQGRYFDGGSFVPVTIPRAGGTITLSGLQGTSTKFSRTVDAVSFANISQAISSLLSDNKIEGTAANASYRVEAVNSSNEWAFQLGTDVKTIAVDLKASVDAGRQSSKSTVVMKFTQVFYTVSFADPMQRTDVFADGAAFDDPENQIGKGNPPLYVSNVKYGRQVFFFATSGMSSTYVKAALNGAYNGAAATVKVDGKMSYKDVMAQTEITYVARGGDAGLALEPLKSAKPEELYDKIREVLANRNAATWSVQNPGIPVAYTLRYLADRTVAMKGFSTTYDRHDCHTVDAVKHTYQLEVSWIDNDIHVYLDNAKWGERGYKKGGTYSALVSDWLPEDGQDHTIIVTLNNGDCFKTHAIFRVLRDGVEVYNERFAPCCWRCCGKQAEIHFLINTTTGKFEVPYHWTGNGA